MTPKDKIFIYKSCVRPVKTNGAEERAYTVPTQLLLLQTTEMKIVKTTGRKTLRDRIYN